jgi:hypothetical protein
MGKKRLSKADARACVRLVEAALRDGYPLKNAPGKPSALSMAYERFCTKNGDVIGQRAFNVRFQEAKRRFGLEPKLPKNPKPDPTVKVMAPSVEAPTKTAREHAATRADALGKWMHEMLTGTRYPVVNPDSLLVEPRIDLSYDKKNGGYREVERAPRTWLSGALYAAPIKQVKKRTFIFTGAQNDCPAHIPFWTNLQAYAKAMDAQIVIGPWTYETAWFNESQASARSYDREILDWISFGRMNIGDNLLFAADSNIMPTASRPISDMTTHSRGKWAVFPHSKLQLVSVPSTDPDSQAHQVMTTGSVTMPKVIPRKAGVKSVFHHIIGATIVEFDADGDIFCRQLNATDDGAFYDLDRHVSGGKVTTGHRVKAVVCGDVHRRKLSPENALANFGMDILGKGAQYTDNIVDTLRPEYILLHDVFDNETRNHHHEDDNAHYYEMALRGRESVLSEVRQAGEFIRDVRRKFAKVIVIDSNHDLGLEKYVREGRYRNDGINIRYGLKLEDAYMEYVERRSAALDAQKPVPSFSLFEYAARLAVGNSLDDVRWVHDGKPFPIDGIECGNHGFRGANGAKGTIAGFARMGRKMSIGDKHAPTILDGVYCAGCMNLQHGYNKGPSSWAVADIVHYPNSKRALITLQKGKWRARRG